MFAGQGVVPMNLRVSVSLCETAQTVVTTYPLLSCETRGPHLGGTITEKWSWEELIKEAQNK